MDVGGLQDILKVNRVLVSLIILIVHTRQIVLSKDISILIIDNYNSHLLQLLNVTLHVNKIALSYPHGTQKITKKFWKTYFTNIMMNVFGNLCFPPL